MDALAEQERALLALRTRAGTVIAAASISGSLLGAATHSVDIWAVVAFCAFGLCVLSSIVVLLPQALVFGFRGSALLAEADHRGVEDLRDAYRAAGQWVEPHLARNADVIGRLSAWFTLSCVALAVEIVLWTIHVGR